MNVTVLTQPAFEPVALQDLYEAMRLDPSGSPLEHPDDDYLTRLITTARRWVEGITRRSLVRQKLRISAANFCRLKLLRPPLISVESVQYYDTSNTLQTVSTSDWYTTDDAIPELRLKQEAIVPVTYVRQDAVRVTYWAGYPVDGSPGTTRAEQIANVPKEAIDAIILGVQVLYDDMAPDERDRLVRAQKAILEPLAFPLLA